MNLPSFILLILYGYNDQWKCVEAGGYFFLFSLYENFKKYF